MKAVRWHGRADVRLDDVPGPDAPGPGEVQVDVLACGICGTDVEEYRSGPLFVAADNAPVVLGHEFAGRVVAVGDGVGDRWPGQLVAVAPDRSCGSCSWCANGRPNVCAELRSLGLTDDGGLVETCNVPSRNTVALPDDVDPAAGALLETAAVAIAALRRGRLDPSDRVLVLGGGTVGLLAVQAALALGARDVVLVEPMAPRRELGASLGARGITPAEAAAIEADLVVECSGSPAAFAAAVAAAGPGSRIVLVGIHEHPVQLDALAVVARELEVLGSLSYRFDPDYVDAARLLAAGALRMEPLVTSRVPLDRAVDDGLLALLERPEDHVKIIIEPVGARP